MLTFWLFLQAILKEDAMLRSPTPAPLCLSNTATALVLALFAASVLDDVIHIHYVTDIDTFLLMDYGKKLVILFTCFCILSLRQVSRQAFSVPGVPWGGSGWLNLHVLLVTAAAFLGDQLVYHATAPWNEDAGYLEHFFVPAYRDDIVKYLDLSIGLIFNSVVEELFFRAAILAALVRLTPNTGVRILIAGLLFGAAHWSQGPYWIAAITVLGWMFGFLYCLTGSIIPGIVVHTLHNLVVFTP